MSVGLFKHPILGQAKQYILNNKQVLQIKYEVKATDDWSIQYHHLKQTYLKNQQIKFYLLPEEIFIDKDNYYSEQEFSKPETLRFIIYEHYVLTIRQELYSRIQLQQRFTKSQLWYFLYAMTCGALEMIRIYEQNPNGQQLQINLDNILLNEYGYIKLVGYFSAPSTHKKRNSVKSIIDKTTAEVISKQQLAASLSIARILTCLVLLKDIDQFYDSKLRIYNDIKLQEELSQHQDQIGLMYNLLKLMLSNNLDERILVSQVKGVLLPYQSQILALNDFSLNKDISKQSLIELFVDE